MAPTRQLAAVLFTDITGYTAMMQDDESFAFTTVTRFRSVLESTISSYNGQIIQFYGDGCLMLFTSSVDALKFAASSQQEFRKEEVVPARMGIHLGEVLMTDGNVFGDAVNIAARIQALAEPGTIYFSEAVYSTIANKKEFDTRFVKEEMLKNVKLPAKIYELVTGLAPLHTPITPGLLKNVLKPSSKSRTGKYKQPGLKKLTLPIAILALIIMAVVFFFFKNETRAEVLNPKSIAVLPFVDMSRNKDQEYFGDGLAEEIINSLTSIKELFVVGRTSSFQFKNQHIDLREIGKKLNAGLVLEGSVQQDGEMVRITAQLIRVSDNFHVWSQRYDRKLTDIFKIQDDIAIQITEKLKITLSDAQKQNLVKDETDPETYNLYLKGLYDYREEKFEKGLEYLLKAVQSDSTFALPYAYIALSKAWIISFKRDWHNAMAIREAKEYAQKSIQLNPALAEGYSAMALISWRIERDFDEAKKYFEKSLEFNSQSSLINNRYGYYLIWMGEFEKAKRLALSAMKTDPIDYNSYVIASHVYYLTGDLKAADRVVAEAIQLLPQHRAIKKQKILNEFRQQRFTSAIKFINEWFVEKGSKDEETLSLLAMAYYKTGKLKESEAALNELRLLPVEKYPNVNYSIAQVFVTRNEIDSGLARLEASYHILEPKLCNMKIDPLFFPIRNLPRYRQIYQAYGFR